MNDGSGSGFSLNIEDLDFGQDLGEDLGALLSILNTSQTSESINNLHILDFIKSINNLSLTNPASSKKLTLDIYNKYFSNLENLKLEYAEVSDFMEKAMTLSQNQYSDSDVNIFNTSSISSGCVGRKLLVAFETYTIPDQLIIFVGDDENEPPDCDAPWPPSSSSSSYGGPSSSSSYGGPSSSSSYGSLILLDTGLISTMGWRYWVVDVPSWVTKYTYRVYAPTPGTAWLLSIESFCDNEEMRALFSYFDVTYP